jgi:hypothetical protein
MTAADARNRSGVSIRAGSSSIAASTRSVSGTDRGIRFGVFLTPEAPSRNGYRSSPPRLGCALACLNRS